MNEMKEIDDILKNPKIWQVIDVRSPGEFFAGHIPGAINIPLFTDAERARVGTLYKQTSPDAAMKEGLNIAGSRMNQYLDMARLHCKEPGKQILIHCWRGGKRSEAMQWLLNFGGLGASRLTGGYKSYRSSLHSYFADTPFNLRILGGSTGSGKTEILNEMAKRGCQVIDLEQLAHHKGSAFGSIGEQEQPTNEQFENNLYEKFLQLDPSKPIWLENESRNIGKVYLPESLWWKMRSSILYNLEVDHEARLQRALHYYSGSVNKETLIGAFTRIRKRLGGLEYQNAINALEAGDLTKAAAIALEYYDKAYAFQLAHWPKDKVIHIKDDNGALEISALLSNI